MGTKYLSGEGKGALAPGYKITKGQQNVTLHIQQRSLILGGPGKRMTFFFGSSNNMGTYNV